MLMEVGWWGGRGPADGGRLVGTGGLLMVVFIYLNGTPETVKACKIRTGRVQGQWTADR